MPLIVLAATRNGSTSIEHAYCVDDVARALIVTAREIAPSALVSRLKGGYLSFVLAAQQSDGLMHNRRRIDGSWSDTANSDDHWGRGLWALGTVAASADAAAAKAALDGAAVAMRARSRAPRAMAYAAIGADQVLRAVPGDRESLRLLDDVRRILPRRSLDEYWPWPEGRLTYANSVLPEAMIVVGSRLDDDALLDEGLLLLRWLVKQQTAGDHLSVVPSVGWSRGDRRPGYAQQPIEVSALAEACTAAHAATGDDRWLSVIEQCLAWFLGANDGGVPMCDPETGGGYDGLEREGSSRNQGAESTLAWLATLQVAMMPQAATAR